MASWNTDIVTANFNVHDDVMVDCNKQGIPC